MNDTVDIKEIASLAGLELETVRKINEEVNFDNINRYENVPLLSSLFHKLGMSREQINLHLYPEVEMKQWLIEQGENISTKELQLPPEQVAMKYANQCKPVIENIKPSRVPEKMQLTGKQYGTGDGSFKYDGQKNNRQKLIIGMVAEMIVYEKLQEDQNIENVKWVSRYAARVEPAYSGYNPHGTDGLGYDIEYTDRTGNKNFVEVKGKADNQNCFEITIPEIEKAKQEKKFYHIIFVTNTLNEELRRIKYLGNLFMFEEGEDLLNNKRFSAVTKSYEIRFKE